MKYKYYKEGHFLDPSVVAVYRMAVNNKLELYYSRDHKWIDEPFLTPFRKSLLKPISEKEAMIRCI